MKMVRYRKMNLTETIQTQSNIIKEQADVIDSLFLLLLQYMSAAELDNLGEVSKINHIAQLKECIHENRD